MRYGLMMRGWVTLAGLAYLGGLAGCSWMTDQKKVPPPPLEFTIKSPYHEVRTLAVAPTINLSGSRDFDPYAVSDALYGELQQVPNLNVLPLNKTLLAMRTLGIRSIDRASDVRELATYLGADGMVVAAINAYDPYNPPNMAMTLQLYVPPRGREPALDRPVSQASAVFNATNQSVLHELRDFARGRTQYDSALEDQKFLMDSDLYLRFVCNAMVRRLMEAERQRVMTVERDRVADR